MQPAGRPGAESSSAGRAGASRLIGAIGRSLSCAPSERLESERQSRRTVITDTFSALPTSFPQIRGLLWYDVYSSGGPLGATDWGIDSSSTSEAAFAPTISASPYQTNNYSNLTTTPIPRPS